MSTGTDVILTTAARALAPDPDFDPDLDPEFDPAFARSVNSERVRLNSRATSFAVSARAQIRTFDNSPYERCAIIIGTTQAAEKNIEKHVLVSNPHPSEGRILADQQWGIVGNLRAKGEVCLNV